MWPSDYIVKDIKKHILIYVALILVVLWSIFIKKDLILGLIILALGMIFTPLDRYVFQDRFKKNT